MPDKEITGQCLCGQIRFKVSLPSQWVAHCHCSMCRRAHGAGYVTWAGFSESQYKIIAGKQLLKWYSSSEGSHRGFCENCGSSMFFKSTQWPGEIHITLANFDAEMDKKPQANAYFSTHVNWMPIDDSLKCLK